mgnify:CR=1 FL=1
MELNRLSQLRARAFENMLAVATCNYPDSVPDCNGGSSVFDGVAYLPELAGSRDTCLLQAGGEEGVCVAGLDPALRPDGRKRGQTHFRRRSPRPSTPPRGGRRCGG